MYSKFITGYYYVWILCWLLRVVELITEVELVDSTSQCNYT